MGHRCLSGVYFALSIPCVLLLIKMIKTDDVNVAVFMPMTGSWPVGKRMASAVKIAIDDINSNAKLLPNRTIKFLWNDTGCDAKLGLLEVVNLWAEKRQNLHAFIGPGCDVICESTAMLAAEWNIPMISWGCASTHLSNKVTYPTFARTLGPYTKIPRMMLKIMRAWKWKRLAIAASTDIVWQLTAHEMKSYLDDNGIIVSEFHSFDPGHVDITGRLKANHLKMLIDIKEKARIIVLCASGGDIREIMLNALDHDMINGDFAFFTIDVLPDAVFGKNTWMGDDGRDADAERAFNGIMNIHHQTPHTKGYEEFEKTVRTRMAEPPFKMPMKPQERVDVHAGLLYDAFFLFAYALQDTIMEGYTEYQGKEVSRNMFNRSFQGITGEVVIDAHGDREPNYALQDYQKDHFEDFADYYTHNDSFRIRKAIVVIWPGGETRPPLDHPPCGWENEKCPDTTLPTVIAVVTSLSVLVIACFGIFYYFYRKMKFEAELKAHELWKIDFSEIVFLGQRSRSNRSMRSLSPLTVAVKVDPPSLDLSSEKLTSDGSSHPNGTLGRPDLFTPVQVLSQTLRQSLTNTAGSGSITNSIGKGSDGERRGSVGNVSTSRDGTNSKSQMFTEVGIYKGNYVALKKIHKKAVYFTRELLLELKQVRDMHDDNVNAFIGACTDHPDIYLVTQYCSKGSLQDVLENEDIKVTDQFKMSFAFDICKGMIYIHNSPLGYHGRLKSSNCVIDSRWVCKITDYGLHTFKDGQELKIVEDYEKYRDLLWTAPELLRNKDTPSYGTPKADVYSYGIILQEIVLRGGPYCTQMMSEPKDIVQFVTDIQYPPYRPKVPTDSCDTKLHHLMQSCWAEDPDDRPLFPKIRMKIKQISGNKSTNLVDNMIRMMEQYADHLEELVDERTKQLEEEKKKTDQLLYQMLPKTVADKLKLGEQVMPEHYQEVTVYFSDIVAFTKLASESTPLQVVNLLNDLYTCFDAIIDNYVCYKVETIGDAYMVVSGIPERSSNNHASEVATMALDLLSSLTTFKIRHMPGKQLQLRSGIHSGPVVAGIVGLKMPRYCLFGDTVNTASRLESSSYALRIHVSPYTHSVLSGIGGFHMKERGKVKMKGKPDMTTYWLLGKDGFDKPLPDAALALSPSEHEFK